jgi:alpha-glucosidase (family GH31 glycosyl hydrolase)
VPEGAEFVSVNHVLNRKKKKVPTFATTLAEGQIQCSNGENSWLFVLSRQEFFVGSQWYRAIWTGYNTMNWPYIEITLPQLLSVIIAMCNVEDARR